MLAIIGILSAAFVTTWLVTPSCKRLAIRIGLVDTPDIRKQHAKRIPYLGGVAVIIGLLAGIAVLAILAASGDLPAKAALNMQLVAMLSGCVAMFCLGLRDDVRPLQAWRKLIAQTLVAAAMWAAGICIETIPISESVALELGVWSLPVTILWVVGATNAVNMIDGLDGLAAGVGVISAAAISMLAFHFSGDATGYVMASLAASLLGFLIYNRHPAKIFLGDSGSLLIGFLLATCAITAAGNAQSTTAVVAPCIALSLPILDMTFAVLRRTIERRGMFSPDHNHIHHRLLTRGIPHQHVVHLLWAQCAVLTAVAIVLLGVSTNALQRWLAVGAVLLAHVLIFRASGAVRLRESFAGFRSAATRLKEIRTNNRVYDELQLAFQSARDINDYWRSIELSAEQLGFKQIALDMSRRDGSVDRRVWSSPCNDCCTIQSMLPIEHRRAGAPLSLKLEIDAKSLESAALRIALLGKLLDRHSIAKLPTSPQDAPRAAKAHPRAKREPVSKEARRSAGPRADSPSQAASQELRPTLRR